MKIHLASTMYQVSLDTNKAKEITVILQVREKIFRYYRKTSFGQHHLTEPTRM